MPKSYDLDALLAEADKEVQPTPTPAPVQKPQPQPQRGFLDRIGRAARAGYGNFRSGVYDMTTGAAMLADKAYGMMPGAGDAVSSKSLGDLATDSPGRTYNSEFFGSIAEDQRRKAEAERQITAANEAEDQSALAKGVRLASGIAPELLTYAGGMSGIAKGAGKAALKVGTKAAVATPLRKAAATEAGEYALKQLGADVMLGGATEGLRTYGQTGDAGEAAIGAGRGAALGGIIGRQAGRGLARRALVPGVAGATMYGDPAVGVMAGLGGVMQPRIGRPGAVVPDMEAPPAAAAQPDRFGFQSVDEYNPFFPKPEAPPAPAAPAPPTTTKKGKGKKAAPPVPPKPVETPAPAPAAPAQPAAPPAPAPAPPTAPPEPPKKPAAPPAPVAPTQPKLVWTAPDGTEYQSLNQGKAWSVVGQKVEEGGGGTQLRGGEWLAKKHGTTLDQMIADAEEIGGKPPAPAAPAAPAAPPKGKPAAGPPVAPGASPAAPPVPPTRKGKQGPPKPPAAPETQQEAAALKQELASPPDWYASEIGTEWTAPNGQVFRFGIDGGKPKWVAQGKKQPGTVRPSLSPKLMEATYGQAAAQPAPAPAPAPVAPTTGKVSKKAGPPKPPEGLAPPARPTPPPAPGTARSGRKATPPTFKPEAPEGPNEVLVERGTYKKIGRGENLDHTVEYTDNMGRTKTLEVSEEGWQRLLREGVTNESVSATGGPGPKPAKRSAKVKGGEVVDDTAVAPTERKKPSWFSSRKQKAIDLPDLGLRAEHTTTRAKKVSILNPDGTLGEEIGRITYGPLHMAEKAGKQAWHLDLREDTAARFPQLRLQSAGDATSRPDRRGTGHATSRRLEGFSSNLKPGKYQRVAGLTFETPEEAIEYMSAFSPYSPATLEGTARVPLGEYEPTRGTPRYRAGMGEIPVSEAPPGGPVPDPMAPRKLSSLERRGYREGRGRDFAAEEAKRRQRLDSDLEPGEERLKEKYGPDLYDRYSAEPTPSEKSAYERLQAEGRAKYKRGSQPETNEALAARDDVDFDTAEERLLHEARVQSGREFSRRVESTDLADAIEYYGQPKLTTDPWGRKQYHWTDIQEGPYFKNIEDAVRWRIGIDEQAAAEAPRRRAIAEFEARERARDLEYLEPAARAEFEAGRQAGVGRPRKNQLPKGEAPTPETPFAADLEERGRANIERGRQLSTQRAKGATLPGGLGGMEPEAYKALGYFQIGLARFGRGAKNFVQWSAEMLADFGEEVRPHLASTWAKIEQHVKLRKGATPAKEYLTFSQFSPEVQAGLRDTVKDLQLKGVLKDPKDVRSFNQVIADALGISEGTVKSFRFDPKKPLLDYEVLAGTYEIEKLGQKIEVMKAQLDNNLVPEAQRPELIEQLGKAYEDQMNLVGLVTGERSRAGRNLKYFQISAEKSMGNFDLAYWVKEAEKVTGRKLTKLGVERLREIMEKRRKALEEALARNAGNMKAAAQDEKVVEAAREHARFMATQLHTPIHQQIINYYRANLLSGPMTHIVNQVSNAAVAAMDEAAQAPAVGFDRLLMAKLDSLLPEGKSVGKSKQLTPGIGNALGEASTRGVKEFVDVVKHGPYDPDLRKMEQHIEQHSGDKWWNKAWDGWTNYSHRMVTGADRPWRVYAVERALDELAALKAGGDEALYARLRNINTTDPAILNEAMARADWAVSANDTAIAKGYLEFRRRLDDGGVVAKAAQTMLDFFIPFSRTPSSLVTKVFEFSPFGMGKAAIDAAGKVHEVQRAAHLKAQMQQVDPNARPEPMTPQEINNLFSEEQRRNLANLFGRGAVGTGLQALGAYLASKQEVVGLYDRNTEARLEAAGLKNSVIKIGPMWIDVSRLGPTSSIVMSGAEMYRSYVQWKAGKLKGTDYLNAAGAMALDMLSSVGEYPMAQGVTNVARGAEKMAQGDFYGGVKQSLGGIASGLIPASSFQRSVGRAVDDVKRETPEVTDVMKASTPFTRKDLKPRIDVLGQPVKEAEWLGNVYEGPVTPIQKALMKYEPNLARPRKKPEEDDEEYYLRRQVTGLALRRGWEKLAQPVEQAALDMDRPKPGDKPGEKRFKQQLDSIVGYAKGMIPAFTDEEYADMSPEERKQRYREILIAETAAEAASKQ